MLSEKVRSIFLNSEDSETGFITNIMSDHNYIHQGKALTAIINTGSISAAYKIGFKTPTVASGKDVHFRPVGITTSADYVDIKLYEGDSFSGGSAVTPINRNRQSSTVTTMQSFSKGVTSTPTGTIIYETGVGTSGIAAAKAGGGSASEHELILKQNTDYVMVLTPDAATTVVISIFWYEE